MYPYMSSNGTYGKYMGYQNPEVDQLLKAGIENVEPAKRAAAYEKLQNIWYEDALGIACSAGNALANSEAFVP